MLNTGFEAQVPDSQEDALSALDSPRLQPSHQRRNDSETKALTRSTGWLKKHDSLTIISDSEEERIRANLPESRSSKENIQDLGVVEISSDEDQLSSSRRKALLEEDLRNPSILGGWPRKTVEKSNENKNGEQTPLGKIPGSWLWNHTEESKESKAAPTPENEPLDRSYPSGKNGPGPSFRNPRSDKTTQKQPLHRDSDVIDLSDSSTDLAELPGLSYKPTIIDRPKAKLTTIKRSTAVTDIKASLFADENWSSEDDFAIQHRDSPRSTRTINSPRPASDKVGSPAQTNLRHSLVPTEPTSDGPAPSADTKTVNVTPREQPVSQPVGTPPRGRISHPAPSPSPKSSPTKRARTSKKAQAELEQRRRERYAQELFEELNRIVFTNQLPRDTKLKWNKRLLTTAGRAKWHRSREGVTTTSIEMATKILDCDERIRNTLSHEMCHLACWIIDGHPKEGHGKIWKGWAAQVMQKRPDIEVTTKHNYEILHPFRWECERCSKIYGRFSNSIRPDECVCGACKEGSLVPLFNTAPKTPKSAAASRLAAWEVRDSPNAIIRSPNVSLDTSKISETPTRKPRKSVGCSFEDSDTDPDDSDVEILTTVFKTVNLVD